MIENWGGSGIEKVVYDFFIEHLPVGSVLLELGSGDGSTFHFSKAYKVFSVESDINYLNRHPSDYIHAPIINGWYDIEVLKRDLPVSYDAIFIDGPLGKTERSEGRSPFFKHLNLFRHDVPMIFHDTFRADERELAINVAHALDKPIIFYQHGEPQDYWAVVGEFN